MTGRHRFDFDYARFRVFALTLTFIRAEFGDPVAFAFNAADTFGPSQCFKESKALFFRT
jgi:hypothetical protein